jgi:hypothetical protein
MELETALHQKHLEFLQILSGEGVRLSEFGTWWFPVIVEGLQGCHQCLKELLSCFIGV